MHFTDQEQTVLRIVQNNLPDTLTPYADIAAASGLSEEQVLALLTRLKEDGTIRGVAPRDGAPREKPSPPPSRRGHGSRALYPNFLPAAGGPAGAYPQ